MKRALPAFSGIALFAVCGCASVSPKPAFDEVARRVGERGGGVLHWDQGTPADDQVRAHVRKVLEGQLGSDTALEVALLRNQGLVATYEELGIAQADLVQAGLLRNPGFGARVRFPAGSGVIATEFSLAQDFLDLFTLPLRKRVAAAQLEAALSRVAIAVLELAAQVRVSVVTLQASQATAQVQQLALDAQTAAAELRRRQRAAGNVSALDLLQEEAFYEQGQLDFSRTQAQVAEDRERVNRLLGLAGKESSSWTVEGALAELPAEEPALAELEAVALARRLDLAAAKSELQALEEAARLSGLTRYLPALQAGVATERDAEGTRVTGPQLSIELPLFDQGQARVARLSAQVRQARARASELEVNVQADVRLARSRLLARRAAAEEFRLKLLPLREKIVQETQLRYDAGLTGVFQLLSARQSEIGGYRAYLETVRDYWIARAELDRAAGGSITPKPLPKPLPDLSPSSSQEMKP